MRFDTRNASRSLQGDRLISAAVLAAITNVSAVRLATEGLAIAPEAQAAQLPVELHKTGSPTQPNFQTPPCARRTQPKMQYAITSTPRAHVLEPRGASHLHHFFELIFIADQGNLFF